MLILECASLIFSHGFLFLQQSSSTTTGPITTFPTSHSTQSLSALLSSISDECDSPSPSIHYPPITSISTHHLVPPHPNCSGSSTPYPEGCPLTRPMSLAALPSIANLSELDSMLSSALGTATVNKKMFSVGTPPPEEDERTSRKTSREEKIEKEGTRLNLMGDDDDEDDDIQWTEGKGGEELTIEQLVENLDGDDDEDEETISIFRNYEEVEEVQRIGTMRGRMREERSEGPSVATQPLPSLPPSSEGEVSVYNEWSDKNVSGVVNVVYHRVYPLLSLSF